MANPQWPTAEKRKVLGTRHVRLDGPHKSTGAAKYAYDINRPGMLWAHAVPSRHANGTIVSIDTSAAEALKGVEGVWVDADIIGKSVAYCGQILAAVAAVTEEIAKDGAALVKVEYAPEAPVENDRIQENASGRASSRDEGDPAAGFAEADKVVEGHYGIPMITHCCLEPHGQVTEFKDGELYVWPSTQNVSAYAAGGIAAAAEVPATSVHVDCQYMGGGFGSKFSSDKWGDIGAILSKKTGKPVKLMLERDLELKGAGSRPSAYGNLKVGVKNDGTITAFESIVWGTGGPGGYKGPPMPYVFTKIPNTTISSQRVATNRGSDRAWRAPGHPQGCFLSMAALEDAAAAIGMDALEFFKKNLGYTDDPETYAQQLDIAAEMIGYKKKAHLRGQGGDGPVKRGLGISLHRWGGMGHPSECECVIHPDGSVEVKLGTQDLGVGTRTVVAMVAAETLGLPVEAITAKIGNNNLPPSGASGGSTTVGGVSASTRIASTNALNELLKPVANEFGVTPDALEVSGGKIFVAVDPSKSLDWKEACALLGVTPISQRGINDVGKSRELKLIDQGVGGVQIAEVAVDVETGVVTLEEMVAVQDCGLIINMTTAESQVYGGLIMGITYALYEECVYDDITGQMLNADLEFYRLAGLKDVGKLKVHMQTDEKYASRGVIGLGEPPVISPGAAISNAVANAIGVRVPHLPHTPDRVINALIQGGLA